MTKYGIYDELERSRLMIEGALANPKIIQALAKVGMDKKEILRGKALLLKMGNQQYERESEGNAQKETTRQLRKAYADAHALYITHVKYARMVVSPQSETWDNLKLSGIRRKDMNGWLSQAEAFYRNVSAIGALLAARGITSEELAQAQAMVEAVAAARVQQNRYKSNKQMAKERRDAERKALKQWMRKFVKAARFVFDEDRQQLEALGIVVPS